MILKWLAIGIGVKRWLLLLVAGILLIATGLAYAIVKLAPAEGLLPYLQLDKSWIEIVLAVFFGSVMSGIALLRLSKNLLAPYRRHQHGRVIDVVYTHSRRGKGLKVVAIGGGTGLPSVLRGLKAQTNNITAIVTVADDGGSSGRLRRELGVLPPGDMRNNIAALADDENLMTKLFQYRFENGDLRGHAFGNLFLAALAGISGGFEHALPEAERVLNIQGRVLPSTLEDVELVASVQLAHKAASVRIRGESRIPKPGGKIEDVSLSPPDAQAYGESVRSIVDADLVVIGPGSLYTSILPNLLVTGIAQALRTTQAHKVYVCNVAAQPGETDNFTVADHILALERYIGRGILQTVLANSATPTLNAGNTEYVRPVSPDHDIHQRYEVRYTDLVDVQRPWRHDPHKLAGALLELVETEKAGGSHIVSPAYVNT